MNDLQSGSRPVRQAVLLILLLLGMVVAASVSARPFPVYGPALAPPPGMQPSPPPGYRFRPWQPRPGAYAPAAFPTFQPAGAPAFTGHYRFRPWQPARVAQSRPVAPRHAMMPPRFTPRHRGPARSPVVTPPPAYFPGRHAMVVPPPGFPMASRPGYLLPSGYVGYPRRPGVVPPPAYAHPPLPPQMWARAFAPPHVYQQRFFGNGYPPPAARAPIVAPGRAPAVPRPAVVHVPRHGSSMTPGAYRFRPVARPPLAGAHNVYRSHGRSWRFRPMESAPVAERQMPSMQWRQPTARVVPVRVNRAYPMVNDFGGVVVAIRGFDATRAVGMASRPDHVFCERSRNRAGQVELFPAAVHTRMTQRSSPPGGTPIPAGAECIWRPARHPV
jgi:hypothetical protein